MNVKKDKFQRIGRPWFFMKNGKLLSVKKNTTKIVLTGGHAGTTALSVVEEFKRRDKNTKHELYWIGTSRAFEGSKIPTIESTILPQVGVKYQTIVAGKLQRKFSSKTILSLFKIPLGFIQAFKLLNKIEPDIVLSFGGFVAVPVVFVSYLKKIPIVIHEQTAIYGLANKLTSKMATKIALSRHKSLDYFPKEKSEVVGNPIADEILKVKVRTKLSKKPVLFIFCGSRGSKPINRLIEEILPKLLFKYRIIHQTGKVDEKRYIKIKKKMPKNLGDKYEVYGLINTINVWKMYDRADVVVARAGANTVSEIMAVKRPSLLIPLPHAYKNEQEENAKVAIKFGIARMVSQNGLTSNKLLKDIEKVFASWKVMTNKSAKKKSFDKNASRDLVSIVLDLV